MPETVTVEPDHQKEIEVFSGVETDEFKESPQGSTPPVLPVVALREEQTQLEAWVHQSFAALERLHSELDQWQLELTEQQADLDQSISGQHDLTEKFQQLEQEHAQSVLGGSEAVEKIAQLEAELEQCQATLTALEDNQKELSEQREQLHQQYDQATQQLTQALSNVQQLEEEKAAKAQELDNLSHQYESVRSELKTNRKKSEQHAESLDTQRQEAVDQQQQWGREMKEMRELLGRQCDLLAREKSEVTPQESTKDNLSLKPVSVSEKLDTKEEVKVPSPKALNSDALHGDEIRRQAKIRRAAKRRNRK